MLFNLIKNLFFFHYRDGSHPDDASDPWISTVTSIESIVARTGYPSDRESSSSVSSTSTSSLEMQQISRSPPSANSIVKSPMNGNSVMTTGSTMVVAASGDRNLSHIELSKSPPKELPSPNKQQQQQPDSNNKRLQPSPSRAGDQAVRRSGDELPEREQHRSREKQPAPPAPNKDLNRRNNDEPDVASKPQRSSLNNSRPKNAVPTVISPLIGDVINLINF